LIIDIFFVGLLYFWGKNSLNFILNTFYFDFFEGENMLALGFQILWLTPSLIFTIANSFFAWEVYKMEGRIK